MNYYIVPTVGEGTEEKPFRPDLPVCTPFAGNRGEDGTFIISTPELLAGIPLLTDSELQNECWFRGINYNGVKKWSVR